MEISNDGSKVKTAILANFEYLFRKLSRTTFKFLTITNILSELGSKALCVSDTSLSLFFIDALQKCLNNQYCIKLVFNSHA